MASLREALNSLNEGYQLTPLKMVKQATRYSLAWYTKRPGFFSSFQSVADFACAVAYPFVGPIILGALAVVTGILAVVTSLVFLAGYLYAKAASCFSEEAAFNAMENAVFSGCCGLALAAASIVLAISALVAFPVTGIQAVARTGTTIVGEFADCCRNEDNRYLPY